MLRLNKAKQLGDGLLRGNFAAPTIIALFNIGLFEALEEEKTINIESFASQQRLDFKVLASLCDYVYALKLIDREGFNYALSTKGQLLVGMLQGSFYSAAAYSPIFSNLESLLREETHNGVKVYRESALTAYGSGLAGKLIAFPLVRDLIARKGLTKVLDLGCGDATFLVELCKTNGNISGYGIDI